MPWSWSRALLDADLRPTPEAAARAWGRQHGGFGSVDQGSAVTQTA